VLNSSNEIKVYNDLFIIYGHGLSNKIHANHAAKIIIATEPVSVLLDDEIIKSKGLIIKSNTFHEIKNGNWLSISIFIDPETDIGKQINVLFNKAKVLKLENTTSNQLINFLSNSFENHFTEVEIRNIVLKTLLDRDTLDTHNIIIDQRIEKVLDHIKRSSDYHVKFADLLDLCLLSESRLIHLFKKEIGITIRKYILWCRIKKALNAMATNKNIKSSAKQAGFTDAAHFNRTFVSMFGINPSILFK
jgi:AraC-like DNA-binding protein